MTTEIATKTVAGVVVPAGSWADRFSAQTEMVVQKAEAAAASDGLGSWVSTKSGVLAYQGTPLAGNYMDVIIVDFVRENQYYASRYGSDSHSSPVCYAFDEGSEDGKENMVVHPDSQTPQNAGGCATCKHNKFGSSETGKGKACKNVMRLGLLPATPPSAEYLSKAAPAWLKVPVMSVKGFMNYVMSVKAMYQRPPLGVVTRIGLKPDPKAQFLITFETVAPLPEDDQLKSVIESRYNEIFDLLPFPHRKNEEPEAAPGFGRVG
jgi:hypothetical protein